MDEIFGTHTINTPLSADLGLTQHVGLFVNEPTRLPLFVPLAPGASVATRMTETAATVFTALGLPERFIANEVAAMAEH